MLNIVQKKKKSKKIPLLFLLHVLSSPGAASIWRMGKGEGGGGGGGGGEGGEGGVGGGGSVGGGIYTSNQVMESILWRQFLTRNKEK